MNKKNNSSNSVYTLILDHWVFQRYAMDADPNKQDDEENAKICNDILKRVRKDGHFVAIDEEYKILTEEWNQYMDVELIRRWVKYMSNGRLNKIERTNLDRPIDDNDDQHYAETAKNSEASIMISGDGPLKADINTRKDIDLGVWDQYEGIGLLHWYRNHKVNDK